MSVEAAKAANAAKASVIAGDNGPRLPERDARAAVILGNDTVVAARPASPAQLSVACRAAGFDIIVPPSWGDELVAAAYLERLAGRSEAVAVACSCMRVRALISEAGADSCRLETAIVAPPVAAARYLRLTYGDSILVTYVGDCPTADDPAINARFSPAGFFASLERQGIVLDAQPNVMPENDAERWSRHRSLPGGLPALRWLARAPVDRVLREATRETIEPEHWASVSRSKVLLDLADVAHCACGANRELIEAGESVRSATPILVPPVGLDLSSTPPPSQRRDIVAATAPGHASGIDPSPLASATSIASPFVARPERFPPPIGDDPRPVGSPAARVAARRRAPTVEPPRRSRGVLLAALPVVVLAVNVALGAAAYAIGSTARIEGATATGEPSAASESRGITPDTTADTVRRTAKAADSATLRRDTATTLPPLRPARRARQPEVVPGWLPQGRKSWTPADTNPTTRRDSLPARRTPRDTIPRA